MSDIFSSRELATGIWALIIIIFALVAKSIRSSSMGVIKAVLSKQLLIPFICMVIYASGFTLVFTRLSFWNWIYLKDIIIWVLFVGVPTCFNVISKNNHEGFYRDTILDNIKFSAFVELLISTFTFHIAIELVLVPVFTFLYMLQAVADTKEEYKPTRKFISVIIILATVTILVFTAKEAIATYKEVGIIDSIVSFCIPIAFSVIYLPFAYVFSILAKYQVLFIRMRFKEPKDKKIQRRHRRKVFLTCGFSYRRILRFERDYVQQMYTSMGDERFTALLRGFKDTMGGEQS